MSIVPDADDSPASSIFYGVSVILASERLIAACFGMKYEENAISLTVPAASAFLMIIFTAYIAILSWNQYLNYFHIYSILGSFVIYSSVVSLLLPYIARRQQKTTFQKRFTGKTTLSGRIQVEENVRTAQALQLFLPFIGISSLSLLLCYISVWTITRRNFPDWFLVYGKLTIAIYYALNASQTLISMLLLLFYHKSLRTRLAMNFPNFVKVSHKLAKIHAEAKHLAMEELRMTKQEEKELYFETYKKQWS
ncbi:unnamed protein product, partial [Mesorhabditis belari]|uniref:Uncharacterized protein n=1 Tax=Mesorhabditis belari TaxID=2138241 RepID=A0AAF3FJT0_9BILA